MLISIIVAAAVGGMTYAAERAIDRTIQQGRAVKQAGGSIRQSLEGTAAGMMSAAMQASVPQPTPVRYDADEFDDDDDIFCKATDEVVEEVPSDDEPETITTEVVEEPEQPAPAPELPRDSTGKFAKKGKK